MLTIENFHGILLENKKVVVISHNDLDCSGSILICDKIFKDYKFLTIGNNYVNKTIKKVLFDSEYADREIVLITDISPTDKNLANTITALNKTGNKKIFLWDHHDTALWLNDYDWAVVTSEVGVSASKLFFNYMKAFIRDGYSSDVYQFLDRLTSAISSWDTWQWIKTGYIEPKDLATLFSKTGINYFIQKYREDYALLTLRDLKILEDFANKEKYVIFPSILKTARNIKLTFDYDYQELDPVLTALNGFRTTNTLHTRATRTVKCVSVSEAPNDLAEKLYEDGINHVMMFYSNGTVSLRSRVDDIHLGNWAEYIAGGGGHNRAAGFTLNKDTFWIYNLYLKERYE